MAGDKVWVVVGNEKANEENGQDEEEDDTVEGLLDGCRDSLARVASFTSGNTNKLSSLVGETGLNQNGPETNELGESVVVLDNVRSESARMLPRVETQVSVLSGSCINANGKNHESNNGKDLDRGEVKLDFTVKGHGKEVDKSKDGPECTDEDTDVEVGVPVLNDQTTSSQFQSICHGP